MTSLYVVYKQTSWDFLNIARKDGDVWYSYSVYQNEWLEFAGPNTSSYLPLMFTHSYTEAIIYVIEDATKRNSSVETNMYLRML